MSLSIFNSTKRTRVGHPATCWPAGNAGTDPNEGARKVAGEDKQAVQAQEVAWVVVPMRKPGLFRHLPQLMLEHLPMVHGLLQRNSPQVEMGVGSLRKGEGTTSKSARAGKWTSCIYHRCDGLG